MYSTWMRTSRVLRMILSELRTYLYIIWATFECFLQFYHSNITMNSIACVFFFLFSRDNHVIYLTHPIIQIISAKTWLPTAFSCQPDHSTTYKLILTLYELSLIRFSQTHPIALWALPAKMSSPTKAHLR